MNPNGSDMPGTYFPNPDCLEIIDESQPAPRNRDELLAAAATLGDFGVLVISEEEYKAIRRQVGLGYKWQGKRIFVR